MCCVIELRCEVHLGISFLDRVTQLRGLANAKPQDALHPISHSNACTAHRCATLE